MFGWNTSNEEDDSEDFEAIIPGRILFFVDLSAVNNHQQYDPGLYAVVQSLQKAPTRIPFTRLLSKGVMKPGFHFHLCHVDSIVDTVFVFPNVGSPNEFLIASPPKDWPSLL